MNEVGMVVAGCLELAIEEKMFDCMARMKFWRNQDPRNENQRSICLEQRRYWQRRLREYFKAVIVLADNDLVCRTPEETIAEAARYFRAVYYA